MSPLLNALYLITAATWDRVTLTALSLALLSPFFVTFAAVLRTEAPREAQSTDASVDAITPDSETDNQEDQEAQPSLTETVVTTYGFTAIWPSLGQAGLFGRHHWAAWIGLAAIAMLLFAALVCIWYPAMLDQKTMIRQG